ncbi:MAG: sensor histidine kinase, partial [Acidimicrobiales bacterium]
GGAGTGAGAAASALARAGELGAAPRSPQPRLEDVGALVERARRAGLPIGLEVTGSPANLPPSVAFAAYRITQEALTNVVRHAPGAETSVALGCGPTGVSVRVRNGRAVLPVATAPGRRGHGLVGMAERAAHCHGWVRAAPEAGGYCVEAWLPTEVPAGIQ